MDKVPKAPRDLEPVVGWLVDIHLGVCWPTESIQEPFFMSPSLRSENIYIYICIYIYRERERDQKLSALAP